MEKLPKVTRHKHHDGSIFQVHHIEGVNPAIDPLAEVGRVFRELPPEKEGDPVRIVFSGGCAKRILELPDPDALVAPCAVDDSCEAQEAFKTGMLDRQAVLDAVQLPDAKELKEKIKKAAK